MLNSKFRLALLTLCLFLGMGIISGCASQEVSQQASQPDAKEEAATDEDKILAEAESIPERPLDSETMALLLEAEFALYRQEIEKALGIYEQLTASTEDPGIARRSAEIAMALGDPFRALDATLYYLDLAPDDDYAIELAARALARSAEVEGAMALLNEYPEKTYVVRMITAEAVRLAAQMEDHYQVEWLLEEILNRYSADTEDAEIQLSLGLIYESLGDYPLAALYAEQANKTRPDNLLALRLRVNSLLRAERTAEASSILSDWINSHTEDTEARISLAQMLASFDQETALPILEKLCVEYPWADQLLMTTAQIHLASENPEQAIPYYTQLTQFGAFRAISFFNLGRIYEQQNELGLAAENYSSVTTSELTGEDANLLFESSFRLARIKYELGESGKALFQQLRTDYPDQGLALFHEEARILLGFKKTEAAIEIISEALVEHPETESLLYTRSIAFERNDEVEAAIADLRTILAFDDDNATALNALGYTLANRTDQYNEAYDLIDRALAIEPEDPAIIDSMGWVLYHLGRYEEALEYLLQAYDALLDEEVISHLAEVLWKLDREEEARSILEQGIIDLPDSELIPETRTRLGLDS